MTRWTAFPALLLLACGAPRSVPAVAPAPVPLVDAGSHHAALADERPTTVQPDVVPSRPKGSVRTLVTSLRLTEAAHGIDGKLQLWLDWRKVAHPVGALLRMVDAHDVETFSEIFEKQIGTLKQTTCDLPSPLYEVMIDHSAGIGSYNGPISSFVQIVGGSPQWVVGPATDRFTVMTSLKTAWKLEHREPGSCTILEAATRPAFGTGPDAVFRVHYTRTSFEAGAWVTRTRAEKGFLELGDAAFPPRTKFP